MKDKIINALKERAEEAKHYGIPQFVMGLNDAVDTVERVYEQNEAEGVEA